MKIENLRINKIQILIILVLLLGIIGGVYLVQRQQIFKGRATSEIDSALEVTSDSGQVEYQGNNTYKTDSPYLRIRIKDLNSLISD